MALENLTQTIAYYTPIIEQNTREFLFATKERALLILKAPLTNPDMLWLLVPLILTMLLLEFYFGRYKEEELGWNTAFGNSLVLIFISVSLVRHLYTNSLWNETNIIVVSALITFGLLLTMIDFYHLLPKEMAYGISSKIPLNFIAYVAITLVYIELPIDYITASAFLTILLLLFILVGIIHFTTPKSEDNKESLRQASKDS